MPLSHLCCTNENAAWRLAHTLASATAAACIQPLYASEEEEEGRVIWPTENWTTSANYVTSAVNTQARYVLSVPLVMIRFVKQLRKNSLTLMCCHQCTNTPKYTHIHTYPCTSISVRTLIDIMHSPALYPKHPN